MSTDATAQQPVHTDRSGQPDQAAGGRSQALLGGLFLTSGAALVAHILLGIPLRIGFALLLAVAVVLGIRVLRAGAVLPDQVRATLRSGVLAGLCATAAYDGARLLYVALTQSPVSPFEAFRFFGVALVGPAAPAWSILAAGTVFHVVNGLAFAVAFTMWAGSRGPVWGVGWGLTLEAFMLALYPGWLGISAYRPFVLMSLTGHVAYGAVLGLTSRALLRRWAVT